VITVVKLVTTTAPHGHSFLRLPKNLKALLRTLHVKVGQFMESALVDTEPAPAGTLIYGTSQWFADALNGATLNASLEGRSLKLGPLVSVFVNPKIVNALLAGKLTPWDMELVKANAVEHSLLYFYTVGDVDWDNHQISGCLHDAGSGKWFRGLVPLPDVNWDQGGSFTDEQFLKARVLRLRMAKAGPAKFNATHAFNKWEVHRRLWQRPDVREFLPTTIAYDGPATTEEMIRKFGTVYIKDVSGSNGRQVMRVRPAGGGLEYSAFRNRPFTGTVKSAEELSAVLEKYFWAGTLIVQQGIDVMTYEGKNTDFRALVQRDDAGVWHMTTVPLRIAAEGCPITSTKSGSTVMPFRDGVKLVYDVDDRGVDAVQAKLEGCLWRVVRALEQEYGVYGEIGIDLAIDTRGRVWFIEANSKPAKDTIIKAGIQRDLELAFRRPLQYARFACGFGKPWIDR
jgi:hypothetical protein